mmetsp:Transcript_15174/g.45301  ORF Transcript_15174/g.45301 Transcript_15174/m.45301 type:complete len:186 (-) Transcript_15174:35-592(-)
MASRDDDGAPRRSARARKPAPPKALPDGPEKPPPPEWHDAPPHGFGDMPLKQLFDDEHLGDAFPGAVCGDTRLHLEFLEHNFTKNDCNDRMFCASSHAKSTCGGKCNLRFRQRVNPDGTYGKIQCSRRDCSHADTCMAHKIGAPRLAYKKTVARPEFSAAFSDAVASNPKTAHRSTAGVRRFLSW